MGVKSTEEEVHPVDDLNDDWTMEDHFEAPGDGFKNDPTTDAQQEDLKVLKKKRTTDRGPKLDSHLLCGPKGLEQIPIMFKNFKSKGKDHEFQDLNVIMTKLEHWAHRLYPKHTFDDFLWKTENLGSKKAVQVALHLIREKYTRPKSADVEAGGEINNDEPTVAPKSLPKNDESTILENDPNLDDFDDVDFDNVDIKPSMDLKKPVENSQLTDAQKKRIEENRLRALEIRRQKLQSQATDVESQPSDAIVAGENCIDSNLIDHSALEEKSEKGIADEMANSANLQIDEELMSDEEILRFMGHLDAE